MSYALRRGTRANDTIVADKVRSAVSVQTHTLHTTGNGTIDGNFHTKGNTGLSGSLDIAGTTQIGGSLGVRGDIDISGGGSFDENIEVGGSVIVGDGGSFGGNVNVGEDVTVGGGLSVSGDTTFDSSLNVLGDMIVQGNLTVVKESTLSETTIIHNDIFYTVAQTVEEPANFYKDVTVSEDLLVKGDTTICGDGHVYGDFRVDGSFNLGSATITMWEDTCGNLAMKHSSTVTPGLHINMSDAEDTIIDSGDPSRGILIGPKDIPASTIHLHPSGKVGIGKRIEGNPSGYKTLDISGDIAVNGALFIGEHLSVSGDTSLSSATVTNNLDVNGSTTLSGVSITNNLGVTGSTTLSSANVNNDFDVNGSTTLSGVSITNNLDVSGSTTLTDLSVNNNLEVTGSATIGDDLYIADGKSLYIAGPTTTTDGVRIHYIANQAYIDYNGNKNLNFRTGDASGENTRMVINENGNVGIGTIAPTARLEVNGNAQIGTDLLVNDNLNVSGHLEVSGSTNLADLLVNDNLEVSGSATINGSVTINGESSSYGRITLATSGLPDIYMGSSGGSPSTDAVGYRINGNTTDTSDYGLLFQGKTGVGDSFEHIAQINSTASNNTGFAGRSGLNVNDLLRTNDLKVTNDLSVGGSTTLTDLSANNASIYNGAKSTLAIYGENSKGNNNNILIKTSADNSNGDLVNYIEHQWFPDFSNNDPTYFPHYFRTGIHRGPYTQITRYSIHSQTQGELLSILPNGNVGIGTTAPTERLEVSGNAQIGADLLVTGDLDVGGSTTLTDLSVNNNLEVTGSATICDDLYIADGKSLYIAGPTTTKDGVRIHYNLSQAYIDYNGDSNLNFRTGDVAGANTRMVINENGNVGIGTIAPTERLEVNGNAQIGTDLLVTGDLDVGGATTLTDLSVTGDLDIAGNVVPSAGNAVITKYAYPTSPYGYIRSFTAGAVDIYMGEENETNPTNDRFGYSINANIGAGNDLGLAFLAKTGGSGTDTFETIATLYSKVNTKGSFVGSGLEVVGNITGDSLQTPTVLNVVDIKGNGIDPVNIPDARFAFGSHGDSRVASSSRGGIRFLGTAPSGTINCLKFVAPNGTSYCDAFCGQRDAGEANSVGLAIANQSSNVVVGFAPSAISGIEKWSFTAKHQSQYTGAITDEHKGMVVEATGNVVGIYDKGEIRYGINKANPDYSNATPVVRLCSTRSSKAVVGVVRDIKEEPDTIDGDLVYYINGDGGESGDKRVQVNAIGEGLIWVANTNGNITIGDLVQSSTEAGYAEKQDDDLMRSCTIAKITANCDFIQDQVSVKKILKDDEGENVLDSQGRLIWVNSDTKEDKYKMRYLPNGRKAVLLPCIYYCG